ITDSLGIKNSNLDDSFSSIIEKHLTKKPTGVGDDDNVVNDSEPPHSDFVPKSSLSLSNKTVDLEKKKKLTISKNFKDIGDKSIKNTKLNKTLANSSSNSNASFIVSDKPKEKERRHKNDKK
ncbi:MAG: hypothetical protein H0U27_13960, partial [Nitrosopumilus sp.]|nr:hypothetical protein [Nitrosopumilus sp.]